MGKFKKGKTGQKVIVINASNPFFGMEGKVLSSSDDLLSVRLIDGLVHEFYDSDVIPGRKGKRGQKVIVANPRLPLFGMEGKVLSSSDDLLSVRLIDGSVYEFYDSDVIPSSRQAREELVRLADEATREYLSYDLRDKVWGMVGSKVDKAFSEFSKADKNRVTTQITDHIMSRYLKGDDVQ